MMHGAYNIKNTINTLEQNVNLLLGKGQNFMLRKLLIKIQRINRKVT
jgi:hypothetical protein